MSAMTVGSTRSASGTNLDLPDFVRFASATMFEIVTTAANNFYVTSVATRVVHSQGVRLVHEFGDETGLGGIRANRENLA